MENIVLRGYITTTSNKQSEDFVSKTSQKTAYLSLDPENSQLAKDFGLTEYTSEKDKVNFFMVKIVEKLKCYFSNDLDSEPVEIDASITQPNFKCEHQISLNIVQGENLGNKFYRLQAIMLPDGVNLEYIKPQNPFA